MVRTQLFLAHSRWVVSKAFNDKSQMKKIEDWLELDKALGPSEVEYKGSPSVAKEMKRVLEEVSFYVRTTCTTSLGYSPHLPLETCLDQYGVSSYEIHRALGITQNPHGL